MQQLKCFNIDLEYCFVLVDIHLVKEIHIDMLVIQPFREDHLIKFLFLHAETRKRASKPLELKL